MKLGVKSAIVEGVLLAGDVDVDDGRVVAVGLPGGGSGVAIPGLVDLQVNGFGGVDLLHADAEGVLELGDHLLRMGVTAYQPTLITSPPEQTRAALEAIEEARERRGGAEIVGTHLEGPFLAPTRAGAHPVEHLRAPDVRLLRSLLEAGGVSTMTLAPEIPGAHELIDELTGRGIIVSLGHSEATAAEADAGFERGARTVTHLFNAMRRFEPRDPGIAGAALARDEVVVQMILDGVHLARETALMVWRAARGRLLVVSDAIAAAGLGDGATRIGTVDVVVSRGVARKRDGTLAGSVQPLPGALERLCELGADLAEAVDTVTRVPAQLLGRPDLGRLAPGSPADVVVLDDGLDVVRVLREGRPVD